MFEPYDLYGRKHLVTIHKDEQQSLKIFCLTPNQEFKLLSTVPLNSVYSSLRVVHFV